MFNSKTISKLNRFANDIANELKRGLACGDIRPHGYDDKKAEVKKFISIKITIYIITAIIAI